jgi:hypothetical protein
MASVARTTQGAGARYGLDVRVRMLNAESTAVPLKTRCMQVSALMVANEACGITG